MFKRVVLNSLLKTLLAVCTDINAGLTKTAQSAL